MFKYWLYKLAQFIVSRVSAKRAYTIAAVLSDLQYCLSFRDRKAVQNNLRIIGQPEEDLPRLSREIFQNFGKYLVDFFRMHKTLNEDYIRENIRIEGEQWIDEILQKGNGGIVITGHIGNWELGAAVVSLTKAPLTVIALPHRERPVNDLFNAQREVSRITVVPSNLAIRKCIEALRKNQLVALAADRDFTANGEVLDFLGRKALIPKGAAIFSVKTGAPIVPCFLIRQPDDAFVLSFGKPIYPPVVTQDMVERDVLLDVMEKYKSVLEEKIRRYPTQWLMFREFWV